MASSEDPTKQQAQAPQAFDMRSFLADQGLEVLSKTEQPGVYVVKGAPVDDEVTMHLPAATMAGSLAREGIQKIDANAMMRDVFKAQGQDVDLSKFQMRLSSPEKPLNDTPLGFIDQLKLSFARTDNDKRAVLNQVAPDPKQVKKLPGGGFSVFDPSDGEWKKADSGFIADTVGSSPVMAGAAAGGVAGAAAGSAVPVVGTAIGAVAGSVIGAGLAKLGTLAAAAKAGIRTEDDAKQVATEVGKEMLFQLAGEGAGKLLSMGAAGASRAFTGVGSKLGELTAENGAARRTIAETMEAATGVPLVHNMTALDSPLEVGAQRARTLEWMNGGMKDVNPVRADQADLLQNTVKNLKDSMYSDYAKGFEEVKGATRDVKVDLQPVMSNYVQQFQDMGLINKDFNWVPAKAAEIQGVVDKSSVARLSQTFDIMKRATGEQVSKFAEQQGISEGEAAARLFSGDAGGASPGLFDKSPIKVSFDDALTLQRNHDEFLEAAGAYAKQKGAVEITEPAVRAIKEGRASLKNQIIAGLEEKSPDLAAKYSNMNSSFSKRIQFIDDIGSQVGDMKVDKTIKSLLGSDGGRSRQAIYDIMKGSGQNANAFLDRMYQMEAGIQTAPLFSKASSGIGKSGAALAGGAAGAAVGSVIPGVGTAVGGAVGGAGALALSSPRYSTRLASALYNNSLTDAGVTALRTMGEGSVFLGQLSKAQRAAMVKNPELLSAFMATIVHNPAIQQKAEAVLGQHMSGVLGAMGTPGGQPGGGQ
jgi:hypothetical protein